jgi:serine protease AprX
MLRRTLALVSLVGVLVLSLSQPGATLAASAGGPRLIVGFRKLDGLKEWARLRALGATGFVPLGTIDAAIVTGPAALGTLLRRLPDVRYVEHDARLRFANYQTDAQTGVGTVRNGRPPLPKAFTGAGVTVALVDTGVGAHPDLDGQFVDHLDFGAAPLYAGALSEAQRDQLVQTTPPVEGVAATHGLSVAATLAGTGVAARGGVDMRGVATGARIVDFTTCCVDDVATEANHPAALASVMLVAFDYMLRHQHDPQYPGGIRVASNTWGYNPGDNSPRAALDAILAKTVDAGITQVFAAGNYGPGANTIWPPAPDLPELLVVGASCPAIDGGHELIDAPSCGAGALADYSSQGPALDVAAPVAGIWAARYPDSAVSQGEDAIPPPGMADPVATASNRLFYGKFGGTSAAAPYVSGVIALMLEANPDLTPSQIRSIIERTAADYGPPGWDKAWGHGEVRAVPAVMAALATRGSVAASAPGALPVTGADHWPAAAGAAALAIGLAGAALRRRRRALAHPECREAGLPVASGDGS